MYSIGEVSKITGLTAHTLRYYEKEGVLYTISRGDNGIRQFSDEDIELLKVICCLKEAGVSIKNIKHYVSLCKNGSDTIEQRKEIFIKQKLYLENEIAKLSNILKTVDYKIWYYENIEKIKKDGKKGSCMEMRKLYDETKF